MQKSNKYRHRLLFMSFLRKLIRLLKTIFGEETTTAQKSSSTTQATTYAHVKVTNEGKKVVEGGRRYYLDPEEISFMLTLETDLTVKSEIRNVIRDKESQGINIYEFETDKARYEIFNGAFIRYPKTN